MKNVLLLAGLIVLLSASYGGKPKDDYWLLKCVDESDSCGYVDNKGKYRIPPGKFAHCFTDTFRKIAFVYDSGNAYAIDRECKKLFTVFWFDNGPDYLSDGLFRITENGKIGFADMTGTIVIPATHDFAYFFTEGLSAFCDGCTLEPDKETGEHMMIVGGKWGYMNKKGEVVIPQQYEAAGWFEGGEATVTLSGERCVIDKTGKILQKY